MTFLFSKTANTLFSIVRDPEHYLRILDISGNDFTAQQFELMKLSMTNNRSLTSIDMRRNPGYEEGKACKEILFARFL